MVRSTVAVNPGGYSHVTTNRNPSTWVPLFMKNKSLNLGESRKILKILYVFVLQEMGTFFLEKSLDRLMGTYFGKLTPEHG